MVNSDIIKKTIYNLEDQLLQYEIRSNESELDYLISDKFIEYGSSGKIYTKNDIIQMLVDSNIEQYLIYDFSIRKMGDNYVQSLYKTKKEIGDGTYMYSLRSSIWENQNNRWQIIFHQGTKFNKNVD